MCLHVEINLAEQFIEKTKISYATFSKSELEKIGINDIKQVIDV